jgi:Transposase, Mutator family
VLVSSVPDRTESARSLDPPSSARPAPPPQERSKRQQARWRQARWSKRDLSAKRYIYFWVDGIHVQARLEDTAQCLLIIIGATPEGSKELVGLTDGMRESAQSWRDCSSI